MLIEIIWVPCKHISIHILIVNMDKENSTLRFYPFRWQLLIKSVAHPKKLFYGNFIRFCIEQDEVQFAHWGVENEK